MEFVGVIPKDLASGVLWDQIKELILRAMVFGRGEYEIDDVLEAIKQDEMFALGIVEDGQVKFVAVATLVQYPRKRILYLVYGAGRGAVKARPALLEAAKILEVDWIETRSRESVSRVCRKHGFDTAYHVSILEV